MAVTVRPFAVPEKEDLSSLVTTLKLVLSDLEDQLNQRAQIYVSDKGLPKTGLSKNDLVITVANGTIGIQINRGRSYLALTAAMLGGLTANGMNFVGYKQGAALPSTSDFTTDKDWGFYSRIAGSTYLVLNLQGVILKVVLT